MDGIHNEMLKVEVDLTAELILDLWRLVGRTTIYPRNWERGLLTPIYKKGENSTPANRRPVCMLSCVRKIVETALAGRITKKIEVHNRKFGFQKGLSPKVTLVDVDAAVKEEETE